MDAFVDSLGEGLNQATDSVEMVFHHWPKLRDSEPEVWSVLASAICSAVDRTMAWWDYEEFPPYDEPLTEIDILFLNDLAEQANNPRAHRNETVASIAYYRDHALSADYDHRFFSLDLEDCKTTQELAERLVACGLIDTDQGIHTYGHVKQALRDAILQRSAGTHLNIDWLGRLGEGDPDFGAQADLEMRLTSTFAELMRIAEEQAVDGKPAPVLEVNIEAPVFNLPPDVLPTLR